MEKRKEFYVTTSIFEKGLSSSARSVLTYLSFCANRAGECFPSMRSISIQCGICRNTVIKAINELVKCGVISSRPRVMRTKYGIRQTSNIYRLLAPRGERKPGPKAEGEAQTSEPSQNVSAQLSSKGELPNEVRLLPAEQPPHEERILPSERLSPAEQPPHEGLILPSERRSPAEHSSPAGKAAPSAQKPSGGRRERVIDDPRLGPEGLLKRLNISGLYENKKAAKAIELAIKEMWHTENFRFKGERIPRRLVRERLSELDIDAIDTVMKRFANADEASDKTAYLKALIYDAPLQANALIGQEIASLG